MKGSNLLQQPFTDSASSFELPKCPMRGPDVASIYSERGSRIETQRVQQRASNLRFVP
jgi:hypothetical protein